jgi:hypothetical protein
MGELTRESQRDVAHKVAHVAAVEHLPRRSIVVGDRAVIVTGGGDLVVGYHFGPTTTTQRVTLNRGLTRSDITTGTMTE